HVAGILHRDIKPENIMLRPDGLVKVLDFGLAKLIEQRRMITDIEAQNSAKTRTAEGMVMGTIGYMAPEQVQGEAVGPRADIFACGAVLYETLAGQRAFAGASSVEVMNAILKEEPPELSEINREVTPCLARIVNHCLEKNPERRFQSAIDLAFALEALSNLSG